MDSAHAYPYSSVLFTDEEIQFTDDTLEYIIEKFTQKEEGVRNLKRCLENIFIIIIS